MKKMLWLAGILILSMSFAGCNSKDTTRPPERKGELNANTEIDKELMLKFLRGIQDGDKSKMYEAANLTANIVNESREKLVHSTQYKLTERQRREYEYALRISGQIDFFIAKVRRMFPKSSRFDIVQTAAQTAVDDIERTEQIVKITYTQRDEAMRDKTTRPVKEMVVHLQQTTLSVGGRAIHGFSFSGKDFEKIADKDFEVLSYF